MNFFQILIQSLFLILLTIKCSRISTKFLILVLASFLTPIQFASILITENLFNYRSLYNINIDAIHGFGKNFSSQFYLIISFIVLIVPFFYLISKKLSMLSLFNDKTKINSLLIILFLLLFLPGGIGTEWYNIYKIKSSEKKNFEDSLFDLGFPPSKYITPNEVKAEKGKNIIVISLESLERGFLENDFKELTPNLNKLSKDWTFFKQMPEAPGGNWTIASLYNYHTGVPAIFNLKPTDFFQGISQVKITGLGHILNKAGYESRLIMSDPYFAGTFDLMSAYKISTITSDNFFGKNYKQNWWGISDHDIFNEAKLQIKNIKSKEKPFAIFISTINTHGPNGLYDKRAEKFAKKSKSNLKRSILYLDHLIEDFILFLKDCNLLTNTSIYIFPDHLLISNPSKIKSKLSKNKRELFLITNSTEKDLKSTTDKTIYQIDLPRLILNGAKINTNATFLSDKKIQNNTIDYINNNLYKISSLNNSAFIRKNFSNNLNIKLNNGQLLISSTDSKVKIDLPSKNQIVDLRFTNEMIHLDTKVLKRYSNLVRHRYDRTYDNIYITVFITDGKIEKIWLGNRDDFSIKKHSKTTQEWLINEKHIKSVSNHINSLTNKIKNALFIAGDIFNIFTENSFQRIKQTLSKSINNSLLHSKKTKLKDYITDTDRFYAHAGGEVDGYTYTNSLEALNLNYKRGLRSFELDIYETSDGYYVAVHGWENWIKKTNYKGTIPPTHKDFMKHKIYNKYSPLDIDAINKWFKEHPNTTLITDKVNDPIKFSRQFVQPKRLAMELFTWDAVIESQDLNLKFILPNFKLVTGIQQENKINYLKNLGINYISIFRDEHKKHPKLVKALYKSGINLIAYGFYKPRKNELFLACKERHIYHGLYIDNWDNMKNLNCKKAKFSSPRQIN